MLTKTTESAVKVLMYLVLRKSQVPITPRFIAEQIGESPTYMAKITRLLVKVDVLRAHQGVHGGVTLDRAPEDISLLDIFEACQGKVAKDYCSEHGVISQVCGFHRAMLELNRSVVDVLSKWTLGDLAKKPAPAKAIANTVECRMKTAVRAGDA